MMPFCLPVAASATQRRLAQSDVCKTQLQNQSCAMAAVHAPGKGQGNKWKHGLFGKLKCSTLNACAVLWQHLSMC